MPSDARIARTRQVHDLGQLGEDLARIAIAECAAAAGRTFEEQQERTGDKFAYLAVEQDPNQRQLDEYRESD